MKTELSKNKLISIISILLLSIFMTACSNSVSQEKSQNSKTKIIVENNIDEDEESKDEGVNELITPLFDEEEIKEARKQIFVYFDTENPYSYCKQPVCTYNKETEELDFTIHFKDIPTSDNLCIYLFEMNTFEDDDAFEGKPPLATVLKAKDLTISIPYRRRYIFSRFVPVIVYNKQFYALSAGQYITNPEVLAYNQSDYPELDSKKGILLDPLTVDKKELTDLNVKRIAYNIPLSYIIGKSSNKSCPTIEYEFKDKVYYFDGYNISGFDSMFKRLTEEGYHITAIILNDWQKDYPEIIHPKAKKVTLKSMYYAFNTEEEEGSELLEATALFLAERYSSGDFGVITDWVIANEVNQQKIWNYMATDDLEYYTESFEKSFRIFYNAIKSHYSNAKVYFSIDQDWNNNGGNNSRFFNGKELLSVFNEYAKLHGDYDWALSIHPYPSPLTKTHFWLGEFDKSEDAKIITPMNLSVLTDEMRKREYLNPEGKVRDIGITELGFSSYPGEKLHAAAIAYCYYIIEDNKYINSFLMNRQTDSYESLKSGLALGIYNSDYSTKYAADIFANLDTKKASEYIPELLEILDADSLEEALERAR